MKLLEYRIRNYSAQRSLGCRGSPQSGNLILPLIPISDRKV